MARQLRTVATVSFYADYPDDDPGADRRVDEIGSSVVQAVDQLPHVSQGSVSLDDIDTTGDEG